MSGKTFQDSFLEFCKKKKFEINKQQIEVINLLNDFISPEKKLLSFLFKSKEKLCFYLHGSVGVGKTMLLNFFYDELNIKKNRLHFNEFMIDFHDFKHENRDNNSINDFVKNLKRKYELIYLDEFQVTNIVDAMLLGKLFEVIFLENIKIIITTNTKLDNLYKGGLQREQFLPFISLIEKNSIQKELLIDEDYRQQNIKKNDRIFYPLNEKTSFKINQNFRELTRDNKKEVKIINTKGRTFKIDNFFNGVARFKFNELCDVNIGAEDYINIANVCKHAFIEGIPTFSNDISNQQLRFITMIDIFYEKNIALTLSLEKNLDQIGSSLKHLESFKRTISRLFEMTKVSQI
jgi:cell division protein ZapE